MKRFFAAFSVSALLTFAAAGALLAQLPARPTDTLFIENKQVDTALTSSTPSDTANPAFVVRVLITNVDSMAFLNLPLRESTTVGTAYALLTRTPSGLLSFNSIVRPLTNNTLRYNTAQSVVGYNDNSPDRFLVFAGFDGFDPSTTEPPNLTPKAVWELRFRHSSGFDSTGEVRFDTATIVGQSLYYTTPGPLDYRMHFMPGLLQIVSSDVRDVNPGQRPQSYSLSQNYPNPFNANTQISFALPKAGKTTLEVFNILGQRVNTLLNEYMQAGYKVVNWDGRDEHGSEVASGIYFYRLHSQDYLQTKKMLLMK